MNLRRKHHHRNDIEISEAQLVSMTRDLDELHHATLPAMQEAASEWAELQRELRTGVRSLTEVGATRRRFLVGAAGVTLGAAVLAACGDDESDTSASSGSGSSPTTAGGASGDMATDLKVAALAASLENLAVGTYQAGIDAATAGKIGKVPPAVVTFAQTAQAQHRDHAAAWNSVLAAAGKPKVTGVDVTVKRAAVDPAFAKVKDVVGLATLALELENVAAATYLNGLGILSDAGAIKTSASIQPVEMQHAAILNFVLGKYPVPDAFAKTDGARGPDDEIGG